MMNGTVGSKDLAPLWNGQHHNNQVMTPHRDEENHSLHSDRSTSLALSSRGPSRSRQHNHVASNKSGSHGRSSGHRSHR